MDKIYVNMASIPDRESALNRVVDSMIDQVDYLNVYLNGYVYIPDFLKHPKISVVRSQDEGDNGDAGKFFWSDKVSGYYLTIDDDILYPPGYVAKLVEGIEKRNRKVAVGVHGDIYSDDMRYWTKSIIKSCYFMNKLDRDTPVCVLGTGAAAYHTDTLSLTPDFFEFPNMADAWFALACHRQAVPRIVLAHPQNYLQMLKVPNETALNPQIQAFERHHPDKMSMEVQILQEALPWKYLKDVI